MSSPVPVDHYVQKALLQHWSAPNKVGRRDNFVWVFDFDGSRLEKLHVRNVFSRAGLNDANTEQRLNKLVEHPLSRFRDRELRRRSRAHVPMRVDLDESTGRAAALVFLAQTCRASDALENPTGRMLSRLLNRPNQELDSLGEYFFRDFDLHSVGTGRISLCHPEVGFFEFPITEKESRSALGLALPLTPYLSLLAVPRGARLEWGEAKARLLGLCSLGVRSSRRVVVPHEAATQLSHDLVASELRRLRASLEEHLALLGPLEPPWGTLAGL